MWTRIKHSLTLRIFLMTCGLMIAVCAATYGAIAYLTPLTYTSILQEELGQKTEALLTALSGREPSACDELLSTFCRETGAALRLSDEYGRILYDTISSEAYFVEGTAERAAITTEDSETLEQDAVMQATETGTAESVIYQITVTDAYISADEAQTFFFRNGTMGHLLVIGGKKAVNQASEARKKTLPFLALLILGVSLLTSFFYARWITRPIVDISHIAASIAALNFSSRWAQHRTDEIGALGDSLNTLSDNLSGALTELKAANERLQQDMERERDMERQRSAFFSAASHELKTPVTILKGQLSGMLAQIGVYRDRDKYLARALQVTGRMESLIKEILIISRIEAGSFVLKTDTVNLSEMMERQLELDEELLAQKELHIEKHLASDVTIRGNQDLLTNALDNVLMNAILYSPQGASIRIALDAHTLTIENTGVSIPEEALPQLFTPFYRVEQSRSRQSGGSGLGLYLVRLILELHNASCEIKNSEDGVVFSARFT